MPPLARDVFATGNADVLMKRLGAYARLIRLDRPIGTYLVLWPTLWGVWVSSAGQPVPRVLLIFLAGTFLMRSAGCAINDYADRHIDGHVKRTDARPLASGEIGPGEALAVAAMLALIAFALVLGLNRLTVQLSIAGAVLAATYPFMKRFTHFPQAHLGVAFAWGIPMAFAAHTGGVPLTAWLMLGAVVCWAMAYDTMYAMVDRDDDIKIGVKSTAILFGRHDRHAVAVLQLSTLALLIAAGRAEGLSVWYYGALAIASVGMAHQLWMIRGRDRERCFAAFLSNNTTGLVIFAGILLHYVYH